MLMGLINPAILPRLQVFVGGQCLGGATDVEALQQCGKLVELLAGSSAPALPAVLQKAVDIARSRAKVHV